MIVESLRLTHLTVTSFVPPSKHCCFRIFHIIVSVQCRRSIRWTTATMIGMPCECIRTLITSPVPHHVRPCVLNRAGFDYRTCDPVCNFLQERSRSLSMGSDGLRLGRSATEWCHHFELKENDVLFRSDKLKKAAICYG